LPDVPTMSESVLPGFNSISWIGMLAPASTPPAIVEKISADLREVVGSPDVKAKLVDLGAIPRASTPAEFERLIAADRSRYAKIIRERKITTE